MFCLFCLSFLFPPLPSVLLLLAFFLLFCFSYIHSILSFPPYIYFHSFFYSPPPTCSLLLFCLCYFFSSSSYLMFPFLFVSPLSAPPHPTSIVFPSFLFLLLLLLRYIVIAISVPPPPFLLLFLLYILFAISFSHSLLYFSTLCHFRFCNFHIDICTKKCNDRKEKSTTRIKNIFNLLFLLLTLLLWLC